MATITELAIKVSTNISDLTKNINDITNSIDVMAEKIQTAAPSIKNLEDAAQGYGIVLDAVNKATERYNNNPTLENYTALTNATEAAEKLKQRLGDIGAGVADDILKMEPTIENIRKAQQQLDALKTIAEQTGETELLAGSIAEATTNIEKLTENTVLAQTEMLSFEEIVRSLQGMPITILTEILKDVKGWLTDIAKTYDSHFNGVPLMVLRVVAGFVALVIVIGITNTQMMGLVSSTSAWMTMWKASVVYKGLVGIIGLLNTVLGTQIAITAASVAWVAVITFGLAAIIAVVVALTYSWFTASDATEKAAEKTKMLQDVTEAHKNKLKETVDEYKKMADTLDKFREAAKSPAQKAADQRAELQSIIDMPIKLQQEIADQKALIKAKEEHIAVLEKDGNKKNAEHLAEQLKILEEKKTKLKELQEIQENTKPLTDGEKEAREKAIMAEEMKNRGIDKYDTGPTAAEESARAKAEIEDMLNKGLIDETKRDAMVRNAEMQFKKNDEATQLAKKFADMSKTPITAFEELSKQLESVKDKLGPEKYATAQKKLLDDMEKGLGVDKFLDTSDTITGREAVLNEQLASLRKLHEMGRISKEQLIAAEQKAAKAMLGQSEAGKMLQDAMEAVRPASDRLNEMITQIEAEAALQRSMGNVVEDEAIQKAIEMAEEKYMGKSESQDENGNEIGSEKEKTKDNRALVRGTVAYTDHMNRNSGKDHLKKLETNSKRQIELAEKQVEATKELGDGIKQCFEVIN